jgi:chemotaxis protein CheZ
MGKDWAEALFVKLKSLQAENKGVIDINNVDNIIKQFLEVLNPHLKNEQEKEIYYQLEMILAQFKSLKQDVSNISHEILNKNFIPEITMDLRSVILQTEKSVTSILDISDDISALSQKVEDPTIRESLMIKSTRILELCNFQDLTGQRIQKIVHHLTEIESVIYKMLHALRPDPSLRVKTSSNEEGLLNGPQKEQVSPSQDDIDALFNTL